MSQGEIAIKDFKTLYENCKKLKHNLKIEAKGMRGHWLYNKSTSLPFNLIYTLISSNALGYGYLYYLDYYQKPFNILTAAELVVGCSLAITFSTDILGHIICKHGKGAVSRTFAKMNCDEYFSLLAEKLKSYKKLQKSETITYRNLDQFRKFAQTLSDITSNYNYNLGKLEKKISKIKNPKKQKKWLEMRETLRPYEKFLNANEKKFSEYVEKYANIDTSNIDSQDLDNEIILPEEAYIIKIDTPKTEKVPSDFEQFKEYLIVKKYKEQQKHDKKQNEANDDLSCDL